MQLKYESIIGFSGINRNVSDFLGTTGELNEMQNFITDKIGVLKKTGDYQIKGSQIVDNMDILGGIDFVRANGTHEHFIAINGSSNAEIYKYNTSTGAWDSQSQSLTKDYKVNFCYSPTLDTLFAVNEADATRSYNGSAWSTSTNVTSAPKGKYIFPFGRRIYILNATVASTSYKTRMYRSSLVDSGSITWDTVNDWVTFDDVISGVGKNGDYMFVGCSESAWLFSLADEKIFISNKGCVSGYGICSYENWTFYPTRDGYYAVKGKEIKKISLSIDDYWKGIPEANLGSILASVNNDNVCVYIGSITSPESLSYVGFNYDINQNDWCRLSFGISIKNIHTFTDSTGRHIFIGDNDGKVYQLFISGTAGGNEISSFIETSWIFGSGSNQLDDYYEIWGYGDQLSNIQVYYKIDTDANEWKAAGTLNGSNDFVKLPKVRGYRIKFRLQEMSKNNMFEIHKLDLGYLPAYPIITDPEK
jgi:hypothetical protein